MCRKCLGAVDYLGIMVSIFCVAFAQFITHASLQMYLGADSYGSITYWTVMAIVFAVMILFVVPWYFIKRFFVGHTMDEETRAKYHRMM